MEPISSLASIVQVLSNAATAAIKVAQFINDVKHAPETHDELQSRLGSMRRSLGHLDTAIRDREAHLGSGGHQHQFKQEEQDILQEAIDIKADCERCAERLEDFSKNQNGSLMQRVKGQIVQGIKRPEIQRLESRIQTNVGTMQLLLLFLKTYIRKSYLQRPNHMLTFHFVALFMKTNSKESACSLVYASRPENSSRCRTALLILSRNLFRKVSISKISKMHQDTRTRHYR
jgi:hypothetical protein